MSPHPPPPDLISLLRSDVESLPVVARFALIAQLERRAAERYRAWAEEAADAATAAGLRVCAAREDGIADMIDAAFPAPDDTVADITTVGARIAEKLGGLFTDKTFHQQLAMQASNERAGATTWRALAAGAETPAERWTLETSARLEEESASFLEGVVTRDEG